MPVTNYGRGRSKELKVHYVHSSIMGFAKCGAVPHRAYLADNRQHVTCKACLKAIAKGK